MSDPSCSAAFIFAQRLNAATDRTLAKSGCRVAVTNYYKEHIQCCPGNANVTRGAMKMKYRSVE